MPKVTLVYKLPEEREELELAQKGPDAHLVLNELDMFLRKNIKYAPDDQDEKVTDTYEKIREELRRLAIDYKVEI